MLLRILFDLKFEKTDIYKYQLLLLRQIIYVEKYENKLGIELWFHFL